VNLKINSWVTIISTAAFSIEAVMVELLYVIASIPTLAIAAGSMPIAGAIVLIINGFVFRNKFTIFKGNGWKMLLVGAALFTAADFLWYDSINKIGSGKTMLLTIPAEDVFIVLLAVVFLAERMLKLQLLGIGVAIVGFTISAASNVSESGVQFQIGDLQAILSAMCNALAITLFAKLIVRYNATEVSGWIICYGLALPDRILIHSVSSIYTLQCEYETHRLINDFNNNIILSSSYGCNPVSHDSFWNSVFITQ